MNTMFPAEKQAQVKRLCAEVAEATRDYFRDKKHREDFEKWYRETYHRDYVWEMKT